MATQNRSRRSQSPHSRIFTQAVLVMVCACGFLAAATQLAAQPAAQQAAQQGLQAEQAQPPRGQNDHSLRVMTFNIRYNNRGDGENAWPNRKDNVAAIIRDQQTDIVGLQEALPEQLTDLETRLEDFAWYGVGRNDGKPEGTRTSGEFSAIFYRKDRFERKNAGTFWLSETPEEPGSKSWDAAITRICSWVELADARSGESLFAFNTHFDHVGEVARAESAKILLREIPKIASDAPYVLTGDFNAGTDSLPYAILTGTDTASNSPPTTDKVAFQDSMLITQTQAEGPDSTWNGFREITPGRRIDYIFVPTPGVSVKSFRIIDQQFDGRFPSDHLPVIAEVELAQQVN